MDVRTNVIDDKLKSLPIDSDDILYKLSQSDHSKSDWIEIVSYLPARPDIDIIMGYVRRWLEIQKYFKKTLRVYAWSYTPKVEKCITNLTVGMSDIIVTALPIHLKENNVNV